MPNPQTAAEWASVVLRENCRHNDGNVRGYCVVCIGGAFQAYARQVGEIYGEKVADIASDFIDDGMGEFNRAVQTLSVETP